MTVAVALIPEAIAFSILAGVSPMVGLNIPHITHGSNIQMKRNGKDGDNNDSYKC